MTSLILRKAEFGKTNFYRIRYKITKIILAKLKHASPPAHPNKPATSPDSNLTGYNGYVNRLTAMLD